MTCLDQDDLPGPFSIGEVTLKLLAEQERQSTCSGLDKTLLSPDIAENDLATG